MTLSRIIREGKLLYGAVPSAKNCSLLMSSVGAREVTYTRDKMYGTNSLGVESVVEVDW